MKLDVTMNHYKLINFIDLTTEKKVMILHWRNHPLVQKWMYNKENISIENHLLFIDYLKTSQDKKYFLVQSKEHYIGVVDFTNIDHNALECDFGLYKNPFLKIQGVGKILQEICIQYAFDVLKMDKLKLDVFCDNQKAINLYQQHNFKKVGEKQIKEQKLICMELENDDYKESLCAK